MAIPQRNLTLDVSPGVHQIEHAHTNCYVIEDVDGVTLVDAGYLSTWTLVEECLTAVGRSPDDIRALLITHGHFDHLGFARLLQTRYAIPVWAHPGDFPITEHPYRYRPENPRFLYPLAFPRAIPILTSMTLAGALRVPGLRPDQALEPGSTLDLPGRPKVIHTPGHTDGSCMLSLPDRDTLLTGDSWVTLDPYTGRRGSRVVARAATHDGRQALASVRSLSGLAASRLLPGHGAVWTDGVEQAIEQTQLA